MFFGLFLYTMCAQAQQQLDSVIAMLQTGGYPNKSQAEQVKAREVDQVVPAADPSVPDRSLAQGQAFVKATRQATLVGAAVIATVPVAVDGTDASLEVLPHRETARKVG
jgi:hypothetical protein